MTSSAIPAVKAALRTMFVGATVPGGTLEGVIVAWGVANPPGEETLEIFTSESEREYAGLGNQPTKLDEEVKVTVVVSVVAGSDEDAIERGELRMWALVEAVENLFRANMKLGGAWLYGRISNVKQETLSHDRQRGGRAYITFAGKARI